MSKGIPSWLFGRLLSKASHSNVAFAPVNTFNGLSKSQSRPLRPTISSITTTSFRALHWAPRGFSIREYGPQTKAFANFSHQPTLIHALFRPRVVSGKAVDNVTISNQNPHKSYSSEPRRHPKPGEESVPPSQPNSARKDEIRKDGPSSSAKPSEGHEASKQGPEPEAESLATSMSKYLHLPRMPHRPTKEELLAAATSFRQRLNVRLKWMSIRSMRPWNADEWGAFVSWLMLGHLVWILVGTTTFFSILILSINTVFAQGKLDPPNANIWK